MPTTSATAAFRRALGRDPRRLAIPSMPIKAGTQPVLPPGALYHFWHPDRDGVEPCPRDFAERIRDIHRDLAMCRPPMNAPTASHPWLMWYRKPQVTHWISPGWTLLFCWQERNGQELRPLPLDARVFANLYTISAQAFGGAEKYFESIVKTMKNDKARMKAADKADMEDKKKDFMESRKIKNIGRGSKFAMHHDGSIVPSRGEANWLRERERSAAPSELQKKIDDRKKQIASRRKERG